MLARVKCCKKSGRRKHLDTSMYPLFLTKVRPSFSLHFFEDKNSQRKHVDSAGAYNCSCGFCYEIGTTSSRSVEFESGSK